MQFIFKAQILLLVVLASAACQADQSILPYRDTSLALDMRVNDLLSRMTLEEKIGQMCQFVGPDHIAKAEKLLSLEQMKASDAHGFYPELHSSEIPDLIKEGKIGSFLHVVTIEEANRLQQHAKASRLGIPLIFGIDAIHGNGMVAGSTIYPSPLGMASSWNKNLVKAASAETASAMRSMGLHWTFTPNVDIARDPRWGRIGETFGEDPFLVGQMGVASIEGLQNGNANRLRNVLATAKHFVAGGNPGNGLNFSPMDVSVRSLRQDYFPPFRKAVDIGVATLMAAHNEVNGVPAHSNEFLLNEVLRKEWAFEGFVVSDWTDVERLMTLHHVAASFKEAVFLAVSAGIDMHMHGPNFYESLLELVREGKISEDRIDSSVRRILRAKFDLGLFENSIVRLNERLSERDVDSHRETALELARQSIVLLSNQDKVLPLAKVGRVFVTGPNADSHAILGDWVLQQPDDNVTTVVEGLRQLSGVANFEVDFLDVGDNVRTLTDDDLAESTRRAQQADVSIVVVGENPQRYQKLKKTSGENASRSNINLIGRQLELVQSIHATGKPTIVVLINGRPLSEPWIVENSAALIEAWEPGVLGGTAIAEILFGDTNPSAKLAITIPYSVGHLNAFYNHKPSTYMRRYVDGSTQNLFEFGFGLSYSDFEFSEIDLSASVISNTENSTATVRVSNRGPVSGIETVQLYIRDLQSRITRPVKELKGFQRVALEPGESKLLSFRISPELLAYFDQDMNWSVENGAFRIMIGSSSRNEDLKHTELQVE